MLERISEPFEIWAPPEVRRGWDSFGGLESPPAAGTVDVRAPRDQSGHAGRIDILEKHAKRWIWSSTIVFTSDFRLPTSDRTRGVLLRFDHTGFYFWSEIAANSSATIVLEKFRNLVIREADSTSIRVLYVASEELPRTLLRGESEFRFVPCQRALACTVTLGESRCKEIGEGDLSVAMNVGVERNARVLRVESQHSDQFSALTKGNAVIRPKTVAITITRASPWIAVCPQDATIGWDSLVLDRSGKEFALERIEGAFLSRPPGFATLQSRRERGVHIRPWIGPNKEVLKDAASVLLVFPPSDSSVSAQIPLTTSSPDSGGQFFLPTLGAGTYRLKLLSSVATGEPISVTAEPGPPLDVVFPTGPTVSGHVAKISGGTAGDPVIVEINADATLQEALQASDLLDRMRYAIGDDDGNFSIVLSLPGKYRIRARWGTAAAERTFEMGKAMADVKLGEIVVRGGADLRGTIVGCQDGEAILVPVPDLSKPSRIGFNESRRGRFGIDGRFVVEGLSGGAWSVVINCAGSSAAVSPELVSMPESGDLVIQFTVIDPASLAKSH